MTFKEKEKYDDTLSDILGAKITEVRYFLNEFDEIQNCEMDYQTLTFGLSLETDSDDSFYIIWGREYFQFDIKFEKGNIMSEFSNDFELKIVDVSDNLKWKNFIGRTIIAADSIWHEMTEAPGEIILKFENNLTLIFASAEIWNDGTIHQNADALTIFFSVDAANKFCLL